MTFDSSPRPPVICLPGLLGDARVFAPLIEALADQRSLVGLDLPPGGFRAAAAVIASKIAEQTDQPVDLVTGSFGGLVALCLPHEIVRSIATVGTLPDKRFFPTQMTQLLRLIRVLPSDWVEGLYRSHSSRSLRQDGVPVQIRAALAQRTIRKRVLIERLSSIRAENPPSPNAPMLWLTGNDDRQTRWTAQDILAGYPNTSIDTVPGGHRPYASHPEPMARRLVQFWKE